MSNFLNFVKNNAQKWLKNCIFPNCGELNLISTYFLLVFLEKRIIFVSKIFKNYVNF